MPDANADTAPFPAAERLRFPRLGIRLASGAILAAVAGTATWYGYPWFDLLIGLGAALAADEWRRLCGGLRQPLWVAGGTAYLALPILAMLWLRHDPDNGRATMLWLIATVAAIDSGAFFAGKLIGGPKLVPLISPNKTWAGLLGGTLCAAVVGLIAATIMHANIVEAALWSAVLAPVSQVGDIMESAVKRHFGVKDSGSIIPGHGGILDRIDGLMAAAMFVAAVRLLGEGTVPWQ